ncbi:MAG TPA: phosphodiester glycosidase family protein [Roseiflexaceae bacterium]|nr:phosphodiester glycosidase family protein [Roseiflexaceae bacterium]
MTGSISNWTVLFVAALSIGVLLSVFAPAPPAAISGWSGAASITGEAAPIAAEAAPVAPVPALLEQYNRASALQESAGDGSVRFYRRALPGGGSLAYFVIMLGDGADVRVVSADGATPGSDAAGDTIWVGGGQHLATVQEMAAASYAARPGMALVGATNFGFFGARTSSEGTVVVDGTIHRVNPWRAALCITADQRAEIGLFNRAALETRGCRQAVGAGPVFLWKGKIANPAVSAPSGDFIPFNPLGENFAQLEWRITAYTSDLPKTAVCVGERADGGAFLVLVTSYGVPGLELARNLKAMGCTDALGADDDTSTQMVWRGAPVVQRPPREVPDALAVYVRE